LAETPPLSIGRNTPLFHLVKISPLSIDRNTPFVNWQKYPPLSFGRNAFGDCENAVSI